MKKVLHELGRALRIEFYSLWRGRMLWWLLLLPVAVSVLRLLLIKFGNLRLVIQKGSEAVTITAFGYWVDSILAGLITLNIIFVAFAALSFATDRDQGVLRHLVIRSISRRAIVSAKFILTLIAAIFAAALLIGLSGIVSGSLWEFGPVVEDGYEIIGAAEIYPEIRIGLWLALLPLPAVISLGLLVSISSRSAVRALVTALGLMLGFDLLKGALGSVAHYLSFSYLPAINDQSYLKDVAGIARGFSDILIDEKLFQLNMWLPVPQAIILLMLTLILVNRKTL